MPSGSANVKNERQYEALKKKGHVEESGGPHRQQPRCLQPRRQAVRARARPPRRAGPRRRNARRARKGGRAAARSKSS